MITGNNRARGVGVLGLLAGAAALGYAFGRLLEGHLGAAPPACALAAAALAAAWHGTAASALRLRVPLEAWWLGLAALAVAGLAPRLERTFAGLALERAGLLWLFGEWIKVPAGPYLGLLLLGGILAAVWVLTAFRCRNDRRLLWFAGLSSLALGGIWRTVMHPPSGDEPALLLAAWNWLETGSLDLSGALAGPAAVWSRAIEFRDEFHVYHTAGLPGGPRLTVHGFALPAVFGVLLAPAGRIGLALAMAAVSGLAAWGMARLAREVTGRRVSNLWLAAVLMGSPVAVYSVFLSPDLAGGALFAAGCLGLATRRAAPLAAAVIILPWLHHKLALTAAGLVAGAWVVSPGLGWRAGLALLGSVIPEFFAVNRALGLPAWPPAEWWVAGAGSFTSHPHVGTYSVLNWMRSVPGLLADRYAGLIYYPAWTLALAGCGLCFRGRAKPAARRAVAGMLVAAGPYLAVLLSYDTWMGGDGAPGRMLVMVFPLLAIGLAALDARPPAAWSRWGHLAVWLGIAHAQILIYMPPLAFRSAKLKIEAALSGVLGFDPLSVLPGISLERSSDFPGWLAVVWLAVLAAAWTRLRNQGHV